MNKVSNIIRVKNIDKGQQLDGIPSRATIYKLHSMRKYPSLIYTVPGAGLVFDLDEWDRLCKESKQKNKKRAAKIQGGNR